MNVYEAANDGAYKPAMPYPSRPEKPSILNRSISDVTDEELASALVARTTYAEAKAEYERARAAYNEESARLEAKFRTDLEAQYGTAGHPKADKLFAKAWEDGHSSGLPEVALKYGDFVELVL